MPGLLVLPVALQALAMAVDEGWFHRRRGLGRWERLGHPLDTLSVIGCYGWLLASRPGDPRALAVYLVLCAASSLLITKDEAVHARLCRPAEHWLHALLFVLHPIVFAVVGFAWWSGRAPWLVPLQLGLGVLLLGYQAIYWNLVAAPPAPRRVNNQVYEHLGERWYSADDDPVALLRAEARLRNRWVGEVLRARLGQGPHHVLDVGCGAGFLANALAAAGHQVTGLDASRRSLEVAERHDASRRVDYHLGDALALPYADGAFDAVCVMDFLEHVERPARVVAEAARVLRPGGLLFFYTFDRTFLSWLLAIKAVGWLIPNTPPDFHVYRLFVRPAELEAMCRAEGLELRALLGVRPRFDRALLRLVATGRVPPALRFKFTRSTRLAYLGFATKVRP